MLLVPAQNMTCRDKALWWRDRYHQIRRQRIYETGMWLVSADVTGERRPDRPGPDQRHQPGRPGSRPRAHRRDRHGHR